MKNYDTRNWFQKVADVKGALAISATVALLSLILTVTLVTLSQLGKLSVKHDESPNGVEVSSRGNFRSYICTSHSFCSVRFVET